MLRTRSRHLGLSVAVATLSLLYGCGSGDDPGVGESTPSGTAPTTPTTPVTPTTPTTPGSPSTPATPADPAASATPTTPANSDQRRLATTLDQLQFGNLSSEGAHQMTAGFGAVLAAVSPLPSEPSSTSASEVINGQFGLTARRLMPRQPNPDYYGGQVQFTMKVDPTSLNYFTLKTWGSDVSSSWMVLSVDGKEVGSRHDGPDELMIHQENGWYPGGFIYRTQRLPFHLTQGKTSIKVSLRSLGWLGYYTSTSTFDGYQTRMKEATVPLYGVYTHTGSQLDVSAEAPGQVATSTNVLREDGDARVSALKANLNSRITELLGTSASALTPSQMQLLAQSYSVSWTPGYQNPAVVSLVRDAMDAKSTAYAADASYPSKFGNDSWGGYLGEAGDAVRLLRTALGTQLDVAYNYGGSLGSTSRRVAWATALRAAVDYGRTNRQTAANQAFWNAWRVYLGNRALLALYPTYALKDSEAMRYLKEAAGVLPWMGNDAAGTPITSSVPTPGNAPFGPNWYLITPDGTSREDCMPGGDYGELGGIAMRWARETGDAELRSKAITMLKARATLRYPMPDANGAANMIIVDQIGCRNPQQVGGHAGYVGNAGSVDDLMAASLGSAVVGAEIVGYAQQAAAEGRLMNNINVNSLSGWNNGLLLPEYWAAFKALPAANRKLPMTSGEPDFVWADRQNMVISAKRGEQKFWANLNWRNPGAINKLARVSVMAPGATMLAEVNVDDVQFTPSGSDAIRDARVEFGPYQPLDSVIGANEGVSFPLARRADLQSTPATNRDGGRADAYTLRFGAWMVGLNAHPTRSYTLLTPAGYSGVDVATGQTVTGSLTLAPGAYKVVYLTSTQAIQTLQPSAPAVPSALAVSGGVTIGWEAVPGAASYTIGRSTSPDGPFVVIATGVTSRSYADLLSDTSSRYYYRIQAIDASGTAGGFSPVVSSKAGAKSSLGTGWTEADIGGVTGVGSASLASGGMTISATGGDVWGTADGLHFAYKVLSGDGSITVRLTNLTGSNTWAHGGIMIRESLDPGARQVGIHMTKSGRMQVIVRRGSGWSAAAPSDVNSTLALPQWLRLTRVGQRFRAFTSMDGSKWTPAPMTATPELAWTEEIAMPSQVLVGVAAFGINTQVTATLDQLSVP